MPVWSIVLLIVIAVLIAALVALTIVGRKLQKKQEANNAQLEACLLYTSPSPRDA